MIVSSWYWNGSLLTLNRVTNLTGYSATSSGWMMRVAAVTSCERSFRTRYLLSPVLTNNVKVRSPSYLADVIEPVSKKSTRRLRSTDSSCYSTPRLRTKFGERAFSSSGPSAWNALPTDICDEACTTTFRKETYNILFFTGV